MVLGAAAVLSFTGCMGNNPNNAVQIGNTVFTEKDITDIQTALEANGVGVADPDGSGMRATIVSTLISGELSLNIAQSKSIQISSDVRETIDANITWLPAIAEAGNEYKGSTLLADGNNPLTEFADGYAAYMALSYGLIEDSGVSVNDYLAAIDANRIKVNPKYGEFSYSDQGFGLTNDGGSLSAVAASLDE